MFCFVYPALKHDEWSVVYLYGTFCRQYEAWPVTILLPHNITKRCYFILYWKEAFSFWNGGLIFQCHHVLRTTAPHSRKRETVTLDEKNVIFWPCSHYSSVARKHSHKNTLWGFYWWNMLLKPTVSLFLEEENLGCRQCDTVTTAVAGTAITVVFRIKITQWQSFNRLFILIF